MATYDRWLSESDFLKAKDVHTVSGVTYYSFKDTPRVDQWIIRVETSGIIRKRGSAHADHIDWTAAIEANDCIIQGFLNAADEDLALLYMWFRQVVWTQVDSADAELVTQTWTLAQRKRAFKGGLLAFGLPFTNANSIANAWLDSSTRPKTTDLGLTKVPAKFVKNAHLLE